MEEKKREETNIKSKEKIEREEQQAGYKERCDGYVRSGLTGDPTIQFLIKQLTEMGCEPPKRFIRCLDCGDRPMGGGFGVIEETAVSNVEDNFLDDVKRRAATEQCQRSEKDLRDQLRAQRDGKSKLRLLPEIFLCQQNIRNKTHAHQSLAHELIHAVDLCR